MTDLERIRQLELEVAALKGENAGQRLGLEAMKTIFPPLPQYQPIWQVFPYGQPMAEPMQPVIPSPVNPPPWWGTTTVITGGKQQ